MFRCKQDNRRRSGLRQDCLYLDVTDDTLKMLFTLILHVMTRLLAWLKNRKQLMAFALFKSPKAIFFVEQ